MCKDVECDRLSQLPLARDTSVTLHRDEILCGLVGDDIDDTSDGIRTIQRRCRTIQHLDALDSRHVDAVQIHIIRYIPRQLLSVDEDEDILIAQTIQSEESAHRIGCHRHLRHHASQCPIEGADALLMNLLSRQHSYWCGS